MPKLKDEGGACYGRLRVLHLEESSPKGARWLCACTCGHTVVVYGHALRAGRTVSCGCYNQEAREGRTSHGESGRGHRAAEYRLWSSMKDRCHNEHNPHYKNYGGRGITVCHRWRVSYAAFLRDMGRRPSPRHTLERVSNGAGYNPKNVRWATRKEQQNNMRSNVRLTYRGKTYTAQQWAERLGLKASTIYGRIHRGWSTEEVLQCSS